MPNTERDFICETHDQSWYLLSRSGEGFCAKCCQQVWDDPQESDCSRRELLCKLEYSLGIGTKLAVTLADRQRLAAHETHLFIGSIGGLLYHSEPQIRALSKKCLNLLSLQIEDKEILHFIIKDIVRKISFDKGFWNESTLDLMADLMSEICLATHPLRDDIDILLDIFRSEFITLNDSLKTSVIRIFNEIYLNSKSDQLFNLNTVFHQKTLTLIYKAVEGLNFQTNDLQLVLNSIELFKNLSKNDEILKFMIKDETFYNYLNKLLNNDSIEIKESLLEFICDLLDEDYNTDQNTRKTLALKVEKHMMEPFINHLFNCEQVSRTILCCLHLVLNNTRKTKSESELFALAKAVIKSLQTSVKIKESTHFRIALSVLKTLIQKNQKNFLGEFQFFSIMDALESSVSAPVLFEIVGFCVEFFKLDVVPVLIPTQRLKSFLEKILANNWIDVNDGSSEFVKRTVAVVKLIKTYLDLINAKKNKECIHNLKNVQFLNGEKQWNSDDIDLEEFHENCKSKEIAERTEIYEFLSFCLKQMETIFCNSLDRLLYKEDDSDHNFLLLEQICYLFEIIIENDLFAIEDIYTLIIRFFSKGYVLEIVQLLWISELPENSAKNLVSLLSQFIRKIQDFEPTNEKKFETKTIKKALSDSIEKFSDKSIDFPDYLTEETNKLFCCFFAINYYCHRFHSKEYLEMDQKYSQIFLNVLDTYLQNYLTEDFDSIPTIKYSLFLCSVSSLEDKSMDALKQFFEQKDDDFYSMYYTNHIKLLNWLFSDLQCDRFSDFGLKMFFKENPEINMNFDEKQKISSFFLLIRENDRALQILIDNLCDTKGDNSILDIIIKIIEDSDQFVVESDICNAWELFFDKLYENIEPIVRKLIDNIEDIINKGIMWRMEIDTDEDTHINNNMDDIDVVNPDLINKIIKLLKFLSQLLSIETTFCHSEAFGNEFEELLQSLCHLIDQRLDDLSNESIFKFFRLCLSSDRNRDSKLIDGVLTQCLFNSKIGVNLLYKYVDNDLQTDDETEPANNKETALFILSVLSENKPNKRFEFLYDFDINRVINLLNSESKVVTESAFVLFKNSFETEVYFDSNKKSEDMKIDEMRKLLFCLRNAVFRQYISLPQISLFLNKFFGDLKRKNVELMKDLSNNPLFQLLIESYLQTDEQNYEMEEMPGYLEDLEEDQLEKEKSPNSWNKQNTTDKKRRNKFFKEEFINFLLVFFELDFVNISLIKLMNEMIGHFLKFLNNSKEKDSIKTIEENVIKAVKTINGGVYANYLSDKNKKRLNILLQKHMIINIGIEHNYCSQMFVN